MIKINIKKHILRKNTDQGLIPLLVSKSLPKLLVRAYGLNDFLIDYLHFYFSDSWFDSDMRNSMYDSCFYTFVSMILTRSERDKFNKLFRKGV